MMKEFNFLAAFLGGAVIGFLAGILLAPEKGSDTRGKIASYLEEKGIHLSKEELDEFIKEMTAKFKKMNPLSDDAQSQDDDQPIEAEEA